MKRKITLEIEIRHYLNNEEVWEWLVNHGIKTICNENRHSLFGIKNGTCECRNMAFACAEIKGSKYEKVCISCRIGSERTAQIRAKIYSPEFRQEVIELLVPILTKAFIKYVKQNTVCGSVHIPHYFMEKHKGIHYRVAAAVKDNKSMYEDFKYVDYCPFSYLMGKVRQTLFVNIDSGNIEQIMFPTTKENGYPLFECVVISLACPEVMVEEILEVREKKKPTPAPVVAPKPDGSVYYSNIEADNEANFVGFFND
jgi:hypothetical protein